MEFIQPIDSFFPLFYGTIFANGWNSVRISAEDFGGFVVLGDKSKMSLSCPWLAQENGKIYIIAPNTLCQLTKCPSFAQLKSAKKLCATMRPTMGVVIQFPTAKETSVNPSTQTAAL